MRKATTTRGYIVAWIVYVTAWIALLVSMHNAQGSGSAPPGAFGFFLVLAATAVVMLVFWIGALVRLAQLQAWGWFTAVLVLHLIGLGIAGIVAYAIGGPDDSNVVVTRPPTAT